MESVYQALFQLPQIGRLYREVPPEQVGQLYRFRLSHPTRRALAGGVFWDYLAAGSGDSALLLLPGALGAAQLPWQAVERFARRYRVIAPSYPTLPTLAQLADGLVDLLDREGVRRAHVLGSSYGGLVAQVLVRRYPDRVSKLVLSHTLCPDPARGRWMDLMVRGLSPFPMFLLRSLFKRGMSLWMPEKRAETAAFRAFCEEIVTYHLTKDALVAGYRRVVDFDLHHAFRPGDLGRRPVLLLLSDDDPVTPEPIRAAMRALYPRARFHLFSGTGHATELVRSAEYYSRIEAFLAR
jgi:pimeloyl-ACP methyl ester carboxylesterase